MVLPAAQVTVVKRRVFLGAAGSLASVGTLAFASREPVDRLEIRFWLSERAAEYDGVPERIREYLRRALSIQEWELDLEYGGAVDVSTEDGAAVTSGGEWPRLLAEGAVGRRDLDVARDVNLLVTDGQMHTTPTGYGMPHVASVGGAGELATVDPIDPDRRVYAYSTPNRAMQVLVHEVGHALGLSHDHGLSYARDDAVVVTPMISAYAFDPGHDVTESRCGERYPSIREGVDRGLQLTFSDCARERLAAYRGGFTP